MSSFLKGLIYTAVPIVVLIILATIGTSTWLSFAWWVVVIFFIAAFVAGIAYAAGGNRRASAGIFVGLAISAVAAGVSCFAMGTST
jgi:hypothetical protein